jgi:glucose-6-phosphate 1-dehydrogenase
MVKRGHLNVPVIGVAKSGWNLEQFRARALDSLEKHGGVDPAAFEKLRGLLRYVDGDYEDRATFEALRKELDGAERPAHYLAIPPLLFGAVVEQLAQSGCAKGARIIVEKPFGHDLESARELNQILLGILRRDEHLSNRSLSGKAAGEQLAGLSFREHLCRVVLESQLHRECADHDGRRLRRPRPGAFYDKTGTIRDVVQNHLLQLLSNLAMEQPARLDSESIRDEKVKVLKAIQPIAEKDLVRGQFRGYRDEKGVARDSQTETFAALKLEINSWRWKGVPFYIRAGKSLPVTCTEIVGKFHKPPSLIPAEVLEENHVRLRLNPDVAIALGMMVLTPGEELAGESVEMIASRSPHVGQIDAYERVLGASMEGDATLFAREDYVEEAWRIVDPVLKASTPVYEYEANTWGPSEVELVTPKGGWSNPTVGEEALASTGQAA